MANVYAVKTGVWSDTTVWNTGSLPTAADDVYANNFSVTIDINPQILSLRTTAAAGINAGGRFYINETVSLSAGSLIPGSTTCLTFLSADPSTCTFVGNISGSTTTNGPHGLLNNDSGTINIFGNALGSGVTSSNGRAIQNNSSGTINIVGTIRGGVGPNAEGLRNASTGTINLTGNCIGGSGGSDASDTAAAVGIRNSSSGLINILGNIIGGSNNNAQGLANQSSGTVSISGNVIGGTAGVNAFGLYTGNNSSGPVTIYGNVNNTNAGAPSFVIQNLSNLTIFGYVSAGNATVVDHRGSGKSVIYGDSYGGRVNQNTHGVANNSNIGSVEIYGNVYGGNNSGTYGANNAANGSMFISGSAFGGIGTSSYGAYNNTGVMVISGDARGGNNNQSIGAHQQSTGTIYISGNAYGGSATSAAGVNNIGGGIIHLAGNAVGGTSASQGNNIYAVGASNMSTGSFFIYGSVIASSIIYGAWNNSTGLLYARRVVGNEYGLGTVGVNSMPGIYNNNQNGRMYVEQVEFGSRGATPISGPVYILPSNQNTLTGRLTALGDTVTFYNSLSIDGLLPPVSSVQAGVVYNVGNSVGTMAVPSASAVQFGVPVDNTVGTAALQPQDVWGYSRLSATQVDSMGDRLRNTATTQSIGYQIASFNL